MWYNYLKISFRNLLKHPLFTGLNVLGLALGLAVSLLLFLHVRQEWLFDQYHQKAAQIYRVIIHSFYDPTQPEDMANAPNAVGPAMKEAIPAVAQYARLLRHNFGESAFIVAGDNKLVEEKLFWVDPGIFDIFDIPVLAGDPAKAMDEPNTVALSRSAALRYFGTENPVGRTLQIDRLPPMAVRGVFEDFPGNSSIDIQVMGSFKSMKWASEQLVWSNSSFETWLLLGPGATRAQVETQMSALLDKNIPKAEQQYSMWLQPLDQVHLYSSDMRWSYTERLGDPRQVRILAILALAVLLIACFNYMNLSTARAQLRFREVGINKTMGASRRQLAFRFYTETALLTAGALMLALAFLVVGIPMFNQLADKQLSVAVLFKADTLAAVLGIGALVVLLAGSYPAVFLSSFLPKNLLQTTFTKHSGAGWLRRSLVTAQFSASVVFIIGAIVLYRQMQFIQQKNLGYEPEQVVAITTAAAESREQIGGLIQDCRSISAVKAVCRAQSFPGKNTSIRELHRTGETEGRELLTNFVSPGIEQVLDMRLLAGSGLPEKSPDDTTVHVLLNRSAVEYLGFTPETAIGKTVACDLMSDAVVTGVVEDFHALSMHKAIGAYAFHDAPSEGRRFLLVKMNTADLTGTMRQIEASFHRNLPNSAFEYTFLDEFLDGLYRSEQRTAQVVLVFSILSVLISCLGLFGLAAFAAERRTKEIGIRKVLGASVAGITTLLARDFLQLVLAAIVIASPLAWYLLRGWLADFQYHITLQWWMFALAGVAALLVAGVTVCIQSVRAALSNPVQSLKND
jgi:putative ABC transport system permease protein